jgi:hypothetical protein
MLCSKSLRSSCLFFIHPLWQRNSAAEWFCKLSHSEFLAFLSAARKKHKNRSHDLGLWLIFGLHDRKKSRITANHIRGWDQNGSCDLSMKFSNTYKMQWRGVPVRPCLRLLRWDDMFRSSCDFFAWCIWLADHRMLVTLNCWGPQVMIFDHSLMRTPI